jgi:hypothetical protein
MNQPSGFDFPTNNSLNVHSQDLGKVDSREKHAGTAYQNEYALYRQSPRWLALRQAVRMRAKGKCEICLRANGYECAHLTYERVFNERMTDLLWVCVRCHRELDNALGFGH